MMSQWHHRLTAHTDTKKNKTPVLVLPLTFWCFCCTVLTSSLTWMTRCWSLEWTSEELQFFRVLFSLHCESNNYLITSVYLKRTVLAPPPLNPFRFAAPASARVGNTDGLRAATDHYWKFLTLTLNVTPTDGAGDLPRDVRRSRTHFISMFLKHRMIVVTLLLNNASFTSSY